MSSRKHIVARLVSRGDRFEVLVDPDLAMNYRLGKKSDVTKILAVDQVYTDVNKGLRAPNEKLQARFGTTDVKRIAQEILEKGELLLTTEQRRRLIEEKRRQIVNLIARSCVDLRTGAPLPSIRVEQAMGQVSVSIDPFKPAEEQVREVIQEIKRVLPIRVEASEVAVTAGPKEYVEALSLCRGYGEILGEEKLRDGGARIRVSVPNISKTTFLERVGKAMGSRVKVEVSEARKG